MSVVGIDFGNVQSVIAVARKGGVDVVVNDCSNRTTPSLVSFGQKQRYLGEAAKTQEISNFKNTVGSLKRLAGRTLKDEELKNIEAKYINSLLAETKEGDAAAQVQYRNEQKQFSGVQLTAMYLSHLKDTAAVAINGAVTDCVISVPPYFTDMQRRALLDAAHIAGLNPLRLMNDNASAALAYGIPKTDLPEEKARVVCFVDVGHSTYTVSIVEFVKGKLAVKSVAYDRNFGGRDLDIALVDHFAAEFQTKNKIDIKSNPKALFRLRTACERAKKMLSANQQAPVAVECIMNDVDVSGMITREKFEELANHVLEKVEVPLETALKSAGMDKSQVDAIEIIGGCSRVPILKEKIRAFFGKELSTTLNSDEAISKGAAFQCAIISPVFRVREFELKDVSAFDVEILWSTLEGPDYEKEDSGKLQIISAQSSYPATKALSLYRRSPFKLTLQYSNPADLPKGVSPIISTTIVKDLKPPSNPEHKLSLKVKVKINIHGVIEIASVTVQEEVKNAAAPPTVDQASSENIAEDAKEGEETPAAKETSKATTKTVKKELPFQTTSGSIPKVALDKLRELELEMASTDQLVRDTEDRRNALEEYIYEGRNKLSTVWSDYAKEEDKAYLTNELNKAEEWLYNDEEDATKSVYVEKLKELKGYGNPIYERYYDAEMRPEAAKRFKQVANDWMKWTETQEERYKHISSGERQKVTTACAEKLQWLENKLDKQNGLPKYEKLVIKATEIDKEAENLTYFCNAIKNTKPPKVETPAPEPTAKKEEAPKADEETMKTPTAQEDAMEVD